MQCNYIIISFLNEISLKSDDISANGRSKNKFNANVKSHAHVKARGNYIKILYLCFIVLCFFDDDADGRILGESVL